VGYFGGWTGVWFMLGVLGTGLLAVWL
jgi:hypothetical protein